MNLTKILYEYYDQHGRDLPWRRTTDPYAILISEVMLQQTQVSRVIDKYETWMQRFPTLQVLSQTTFPEVLRYWIGLGYNRRAKYLYDLSNEITNNYGGCMPKDRQALIKLPGMGPYTSAAVCVFAYNQPIPLIETNVRTVFIHHFFTQSSDVADKELLPLVKRHLDKSNPRKWFNAIMDYGSHLKETVGNVSRKSTQYHKQSTYEGSLRQIRSQILKALVNHQPILKNSHLDKAVESLIKDGLIKKTPDGEIVLMQ